MVQYTVIGLLANGFSSGVVELHFVMTEFQLADFFSKPLPGERFRFSLQCLGMKSHMPVSLKSLRVENEE